MVDESNSIPEWDTRLALDNIDGDPADLKELLEIWLTQEPVLISRIQAALENQDTAQLHLAAHTLKGSLKLFGFLGASSKAQQMENAGKSGQIAEGAKILQLLENELRLVSHHVQGFLATN